MGTVTSVGATSGRACRGGGGTIAKNVEEAVAGSLETGRLDRGRGGRCSPTRDVGGGDGTEMVAPVVAHDVLRGGSGRAMSESSSTLMCRMTTRRPVRQNGQGDRW